MKILLDENLPYALARSFPVAWDLRSTQRMGWNGKGNGELLRLAAARGFDALITADRNMPNEQNRNTPLPVVVFRTPSLRVQDLQLLVPQATALLEGRRSRTFHIVGETKRPDRTRERRRERGCD
ncbi:MAG: hypothetical protein OXH99_16410 [Bryobacterales bacterium]|nr:hypothetical protein [Bryobacterales bacterium]